MSDPHLFLKQAAGRFAVQFIKSGMILGLGSGTTATCFIESLGQRIKKENLKIKGVASSKRSFELSQKAGIEMLDDRAELDLTVDGADEVDPQKRMIKGGGGALVREKILAASCKEMIVIIDESKLVKNLGAFGLPIEIIPFCPSATLHKLNALGLKGHLRLDKEGHSFVTENGNYIIDLAKGSSFDDPKAIENKLIQIPGVVDTGFFIGFAGRVIVGKSDGSVEMLT